MKKLILVAMMAVCFSAIAKKPITVSQTEQSDNPEIVGLLGVLGAYQATAHIYADSLDAKYYEVWMVICNDSITEKRSMGVVPVKSDSTSIVITAMPKDSMTVAIYVNGSFLIQEAAIPTDMHLLIGCDFKWEFNESDTIPLLAYSSGIKGKRKINGQIYEAYDICGLRYSKIHPSEWKKKFNVAPYIYFEAVPVKERSF